MLPIGDTPRDRQLAAAFDEPSRPYTVRCGLVILAFRPFSLAVFRRAMTIGIDAVRLGFAAIQHDETRLVEDCTALSWILRAPLDEVATAMRTSRWKVAIAAHDLPLAELACVRVEVERHMRLIRAAMFGVVKRPPISDAAEKAESEEKEMEPGDILQPGRIAALALSVHRETGWNEDFIQEWLPLCRLLQYAHGIQWSNPQIWTVDPWGDSVSADDPLAQLDAVREVRAVTPIEF